MKYGTPEKRSPVNNIKEHFWSLIRFQYDNDITKYEKLIKNIDADIEKVKGEINKINAEIEEQKRLFLITERKQ